MDADPALQVESFAGLMARLDDPFNEPAHVLAAAGLDPDRHRALVASWRARLDSDETGTLAEQFAEAYATERLAVAEKRRVEVSGEAPAVDARFLNGDAQSFRDEAAKVARDPTPPEIHAQPAIEVASTVPVPVPVIALPTYAIAPSIQAAPAIPPQIARPPAYLAGTADISAAVPRAVVPFAPGPSFAAIPSVAKPQAVSTGTMDISAAVAEAKATMPFAGPAPGPPPAPPPPAAHPKPPAHLAGTADISEAMAQARTILPFSGQAQPPPPAPPPPAPALTAPPRKRLIRFDPQTGQPLPAPIWVDLPPDPEKR